MLLVSTTRRSEERETHAERNEPTYSAHLLHAFLVVTADVMAGFLSGNTPESRAHAGRFL
jgi:hypothetical protein